MKRRLSYIYYALILSFISSVNIYGTTYTITLNHLEYTIDTDLNATTVTGFDNEIAKVEIPSSVKYNGQSYPVKTVGGSAFKKALKIESIKIPSSVERIEDQAFALCENLTKVEIVPGGLKYIGNSAFNKCSLTSFIIPETCETIEALAFYRCDSLEEIIIPEKTTDLKAHIFWLCTSLKKAQLPDNLTEIPHGMFDGCSSLEYVNFPSKLEVINDNAFNETDLRSVILPYGVRTIGEYAFYWNKNLELLVLPETLESIGMFAFAQEFLALEEITVPNSVIDIAPYAFLGCDQVKTITFGKSVKNIGCSVISSYGNVLKTINCYAPVPPSVVPYFEETIFGRLTPEAIQAIELHVPCESYDSYMADDQWNIFGKVINDLEESGIENAIVDYSNHIEVYSTGGIKVLGTNDINYISSLPKGIYILVQGAKTSKIIKK